MYGRAFHILVHRLTANVQVSAMIARGVAKSCNMDQQEPRHLWWCKCEECEGAFWRERHRLSPNVHLCKRSEKPTFETVCFTGFLHTHNPTRFSTCNVFPSRRVSGVRQNASGHLHSCPPFLMIRTAPRRKRQMDIYKLLPRLFWVREWNIHPIVWNRRPQRGRIG